MGQGSQGHTENARRNANSISPYFTQFDPEKQHGIGGNGLQYGPGLDPRPSPSGQIWQWQVSAFSQLFMSPERFENCQKAGKLSLEGIFCAKKPIPGQKNKPGSASMPALFYSQTHWLSTIPTTQTYPDRLSVARKIIAQNIPERIHTPSSLEQLQRPSTKKYCRLYVVLSLWLKLPWSRKGKVFQKAESYTFNPPSRNPYRVRTPSVNTVFGERSVYAWEKATLVVHLLFPATVQSKSCLRYSQLGCTLHQKNMWGSQWGSL